MITVTDNTVEAINAALLRLQKNTKTNIKNAASTMVVSSAGGTSVGSSGGTVTKIIAPENNYNEDIERLGNEIDDNKNSIDSISSQINNFNNSINQNRTNISKNKNDIDALATKINNLSTNQASSSLSVENKIGTFTGTDGNVVQFNYGYTLENDSESGNLLLKNGDETVADLTLVYASKAGKNTNGTDLTLLDLIKSYIPNQTSSSNQLADKNFVNSSISTNTANFLGTNDTATTESAFLTWANDRSNKTNNDYVFWKTDDSVKRYKWNGTSWVYEYTLNNSSFTSDQWASINSGITASDVEKLAGLTNVTESTVSGWGFTKNTGTYSKPSTGIPKTDLASDVQTSLGKADTALQSAPVTSVAGKTGAVTLAKSDVGLGNVGNFKAVSTVANQGLTDTEKTNARSNIGAGTSSFSGNYNDLTNKPTIPSVVDNLTSDSTTSALSAKQGKALKSLVDGKTSNTGTVTSVAIKMNNSQVGSAITSSGTIDLGTVLTSHQDISGKLDKSGGTMTGNLTLKANQYERQGALNCNNSDIIGLNSLYTADNAENTSEGIRFYRDATHWDTITASKGVLYFMPNDVASGTAFTSAKKVAMTSDIPTKASTSISKSGSITASASGTGVSSSATVTQPTITNTITQPVFTGTATSGNYSLSHSVNNKRLTLTGSFTQPTISVSRKTNVGVTSTATSGSVTITNTVTQPTISVTDGTSFSATTTLS